MTKDEGGEAEYCADAFDEMESPVPFTLILGGSIVTVTSDLLFEVNSQVATTALNGIQDPRLTSLCDELVTFEDQIRLKYGTSKCKDFDNWIESEEIAEKLDEFIRRASDLFAFYGIKLTANNLQSWVDHYDQEVERLEEEEELNRSSASLIKELLPHLPVYTNGVNQLEEMILGLDKFDGQIKQLDAIKDALDYEDYYEDMAVDIYAIMRECVEKYFDGDRDMFHDKALGSIPKGDFVKIYSNAARGQLPKSTEDSDVVASIVEDIVDDLIDFLVSQRRLLLNRISEARRALLWVRA